MVVRFSVFIPVRNDVRWLPGAIESVLGQSHPHWELVIGDNASTEDLGAVVARYDDHRIHYHRWPTTVPPADNFNRTVARCEFEWLLMLSADDRLLEECLARLAARIEEAAATPPRIALALTACRRIDEDGQPAERRYYRSTPVNHISEGRYDAASWLWTTADPGALPWNIGSLALSRDVLAEMGGFYRGEVGLSADVEMATRAAAYGDVIYIAEPLLDYTVRDDSMRRVDFERGWARRNDATTMGAALLSALIVHEDRRNVTAAERRHVLAQVARTHIQRTTQHRWMAGGGGRRGALRDFLLALRYEPRTALSLGSLGRTAVALIAPAAVIARARRRFDGPPLVAP